MALIGDPQLVLLDEPSAGMDPKARRFMWSVIQEISMARKQAAVILTTHSMEECEALCNRAVIMVNGQFRTIGTHVEIKRAYGQGRELVVKLVPPSKEEMTDAMRTLRGAGEEIKQTDVVSVLPESETAWVKSAAASSMAPFRVQLSEEAIKEKRQKEKGWCGKKQAAAASNDDQADLKTSSPAVFAEWLVTARAIEKFLVWVAKLDSNVVWLQWIGNTLKLKLSESKGLGELFGQLHANKEDLRMLEYALSPSTLEQIFHRFALEQTAEDENAEGVAIGAGKLDELATLLAEVSSKGLPTCQSCGKQVKGKFCTACGTALPADAAPPAATAVTAPTKERPNSAGSAGKAAEPIVNI